MHAYKVKLGQSTTYGKTGVCTAMTAYIQMGTHVRICSSSNRNSDTAQREEREKEQRRGEM